MGKQKGIKAPALAGWNNYYGITVAGALYVVAFMLIALAAVNTQRAMLLLLFGVMFGLFLVSVLIARTMLLAVDVRRDLPEGCFAGQVVYLGYRLTHRRGHLPALGLELEERYPPAELETVGAFCLHLSPEGTFQSGSRFIMHRRGQYKLSCMGLSTRFPFYLGKAYRDVPQEDKLIVWPRLGRLKLDLLARGAVEVSDAAPSAVGRGSDEFFGLREYRQGDSLRWIHWKRSAATGGLVVREMSKPRPEVLYVVLDTLLVGEGEVEREAREKRIRLAATLIENVFRREYRIGLALAMHGRVVATLAQAARGQRRELFDLLAEVDDNRDTPLDQVVAAINPRQIRYAHVVVIAQAGLSTPLMRALATSSGQLTVLTEGQLDAVFDDTPPATASESLP